MDRKALNRVRIGDETVLGDRMGNVALRKGLFGFVGRSVENGGGMRADVAVPLCTLAKQYARRCVIALRNIGCSYKEIRDGNCDSCPYIYRLSGNFPIAW